MPAYAACPSYRIGRYVAIRAPLLVGWPSTSSNLVNAVSSGKSRLRPPARTATGLLGEAMV
jgi:hypothetical protein